MRRLHPVAPAERFIASGVHEHFRDGRPTGEVEYWSVHEQPGGSRLVRVDRDGRRTTDARSLLIEAFQTPSGITERVNLRFYGGAADLFKLTRASYTLFDERIEIGVSVDDAPRADSVVPLSGVTIVCPDAAVFRGWALWQMQSDANLTAIVVLEAAGRTVTQAVISLEHIGTADVVVDGRIIRTQGWLGMSVPGFDGEWWLDAHGALLRHRSSGGEEIRLSQYARQVESVHHD